MFSMGKNLLTRISLSGYKIKHIYKTAPILQWNPSIFGGFFPSAKSFHAQDRRFSNSPRKGG